MERNKGMVFHIAQIPLCTSHISHNASFCNRNVHISVTKWCIVWYLSNASCDLWDGSDNAGIIFCMRLANERRRYIVTLSLIGWAHTENDLCNGLLPVSASSCYLNQWWLIVSWTLRIKFQWNLNNHTMTFIQENVFEICIEIIPFSRMRTCFGSRA